MIYDTIFIFRNARQLYLVLQTPTTVITLVMKVSNKYISLFYKTLSEKMRVCVRVRVRVLGLLYFLQSAGMKLSASFSPTTYAVNMHILVWKFLCAV